MYAYSNKDVILSLSVDCFYRKGQALIIQTLTTNKIDNKQTEKSRIIRTWSFDPGYNNLNAFCWTKIIDNNNNNYLHLCIWMFVIDKLLKEL